MGNLSTWIQSHFSIGCSNKLEKEPEEYTRPKKLKLFRRLEDLHYQADRVDLNSPRLMFNALGDDYFFTFESAQGTVNIHLTYRWYMSEAFTYLSGLTHKSIYTLEYKAPNYQFHLKVDDCNYLEVDEIVGDVNAKSIDLSLLELEEYLRNNFGSVSELRHAEQTKEEIYEQMIEDLSVWEL